MIIVSACLAGIKCRYDGSSSDCAAVIDLVKKGKAIPICPEQVGGLSTPRKPCEQRNGRIVSCDGEDFTDAFMRGAANSVKIALVAGCKEAILKSKSPSCGYGLVFDGTFSGKTIRGNGVFADMLEKKGIKVRTEKAL